MSDVPCINPVRLPVRAPVCDGLFMPAEWYPHEACWMGWPCKPSSWRNGLDVARKAYTDVAHAIARFEPVRMIVPPGQERNAVDLLGSDIEIVPMELYDSWTRDHAPTFLIDGKGGVAGVDWVFNDWGHIGRLEGRYDEALAVKMLQHLEMRRYAAPCILEGGGIHVDGEGTLITTEQVQFDPNRNAGFSRKDMEDLFAAYLGVEKTVWLGEGLEDDETNGHVDILACFARPGVILVNDCTDPDDHNYQVSQDAIRRLEAATDARGRSFDILRLPQPSRYMLEDGVRLDSSYVNFYIANKGIVMSSFGEPADDTAKGVIQEAFPGYDVVQVPSLEIFLGGGGIHCITQQQPQGDALPVF